jgi:hypothetical protein
MPSSQRRRRYLTHHVPKIPSQIDLSWTNDGLANSAVVGALSFAATCGLGCTLQASLYNAWLSSNVLPPVLSLTLGLCTLAVASNVAAAAAAKLYAAPFCSQPASQGRLYRRIQPHSRRRHAAVGSIKTRENRIPSLSRSIPTHRTRTLSVGRFTGRRKDKCQPAMPLMEHVCKAYVFWHTHTVRVCVENGHVVLCALARHKPVVRLCFLLTRALAVFATTTHTITFSHTHSLWIWPV